MPQENLPEYPPEAPIRGVAENEMAEVMIDELDAKEMERGRKNDELKKIGSIWLLNFALSY